jgi:hypothetical protein
MLANATDTTPLPIDVFLNPDGSCNHGRVFVAIGAFTGASLFCNVELAVLVCMRFKKRTGLYFWSIVLATFGSLLYNIEVILAYFVTVSVPTWAFAITGVLGYLIYIPAEYLVLYSRLHLLSTSSQVLRWVIALATAQYVLISIPLAVTWIWGLVDPQNTTNQLLGDRIQQIEVCTYTAVEIALSSIYIVQTLRMWGTDPGPLVKKILVHLVCINALLVCLNCANVAILYTDRVGLDNGWIVGSPVSSTIEF